jgi:hypothetical protein
VTNRLTRTAVLALALAGCGRRSATPADLLIINARVFPADGSTESAEALAIRGNQIVAIGPADSMADFRGPATRVVDAKGGTVMPGFNDAHVHFLEGSLSLANVNLLEAEKLDQIQQAIRDFAAANPNAPWVLGRGWLYGAFPGGMPTRQQLDALVPDRPAAMSCYDGHTLWVNSKALALAGITKDTPNPPNGSIVRDPKTGEPTGALKEAAQSLVDGVIPKPTRAEKLAAMKRGITEAHRYGVTSIQEAGVSLEDFTLFDSLRRAGELPLRAYVAMNVDSGWTVQDADRLDSLRKAHADTPTLRLGMIKLYADGVIEARTAYMLAPYANAPMTGNPEMTPAEMARIVKLMDARGWQIEIHAIGDAGIRMALDAFEQAAAQNPAPARGRRHRLEHIEDVSAADIPRFGSLGVIASMQPFHASPNQNVLDVWAVNVGPERAARAWAWKSIHDAGGHLAFGTDWPVVGIDPRPGMHTALTRQTMQGVPAGGFNPAERLPLSTVLETYTAGSAYAGFDEKRVGMLKVGMLADVVVWSGDLFARPVDQVKDAEVTMTIFDGRVVYEKQ